MSKLGSLLMFILIVSCIISTFFISGCAEDKEIKIGAILPLTGEAAKWGEQAKDAINLAIELNNNKFASRITIKYQDTKDDTKEASNAARFLINVEGVQAIIGDMTSAKTLNAAPRCEQNKVVLLSPVASSPKITNAGEFIYRIWPSDVFEAEFSTQWFYNHNFRKVAIVYLLDDFGLPLKETFEKKFTATGGSIVFSEGYSSDVNDFRTIISKLSKTEADAIYLISHYNDAATFLRQKTELGSKLPVVGTADLKN